MNKTQRINNIRELVNSVEIKLSNEMEYYDHCRSNIKRLQDTKIILYDLLEILEKKGNS